MKFQLDQSAADRKEGLKLLLEERGHELLEGGACADTGICPLVCWEPGEENEVSVSLKKGVLTVRCREKVHFFRGFMKALNDIETHTAEAEYELQEKVWFQSVGAMLDCSRNGVLKTEKIREYIRRMASLGMNLMMLYTEETYEIPEYPYFGAFRGRYTREEMKACDDYAGLFGIEIVPCIQTLAHLHTALRWKTMAGLTDTPDILLAGDEEVYRLIDAMINSVSSAFRSRRVHLGMDEAHELGLGNYLNKNGYQNRFEIMNNHLKRVLSICQKYGMKPMIWSDMYFRLKSPDGDYYNLPPETEFSDLPEFPEGVSMVYWDYYHDEKAHYENYIKLHKKLSDQLLFAGGAWIWNGVAPNYSWMSATLMPALEACRENGVSEVICTFWQDNGAETPMAAGNLSLTTFAEACFSEKNELQRKEKRVTRDDMEFLWGDCREAWWLLDRFDHVPGVGKDNRYADNPSKFLLYQDVMLGLFDEQIRGLGLSEHYRRLAEDLAGYRRLHPGASILFEYYEVMARLLEMKSELGIRIYDSYHAGDKRYLAEAEQSILPSCIQLTERLAMLRETLWMEECKVFGYEVLDIRLAGVKARLEYARRRLAQYRSGGTGRLLELEEKRLIYAPDETDGDHALCSCNFWQNIVSAGNIAGI
ncbi:MAG: beta-N-acetylhexosaminidase [Hungatella hathewayi]|uniref:beta-N-acetylhexosaminidase n=1 Tax=Hungatella TaxID=1649459 RepID=UPI0011060425|nr:MULTISPECIES: beta-N-acetylhexosaminidase [Hungatella]MCI7383908.1 beta-N-acetylhexosaminidase [Hungatella sp.]MDY6236956.1 beta-N-acetylhexosaminidase [Hungatella hathewayi]